MLPSLDAILRKALPFQARIALRAVVAEAERQNMPVYLVGGFVRDLLLGRPSLDLDVVVEGPAIRLGRSLVERMGGRLVVHKPFGTAVWWPRDQKKGAAAAPGFIDLISARSESYARPVALPTVKFDSIRADQFRRDFTINTLALRLDGSTAGQLLDPWGGLADLRTGVLRTLHPGSFADDPTRILRILRFAGRLGFRVEPDTLAQLKRKLPGLELLSGDRIRNELELTLLEKNRVEILRDLQRLAVLRHIHPRLRLVTGTATLLERAASKAPPTYWDLRDLSSVDLGFVIWFMHFAAQEVAELAKRLRFNKDLQTASEAAARLRAQHRSIGRMPASRLVSRLEKEPQLAVYAFYLAHEHGALGRALEKYARSWRHIRPGIDGNTLRKRGLAPGPAYKKILESLRAARLDGQVRTAKQEAQLLERLLDEHH